MSEVEEIISVSAIQSPPNVNYLIPLSTGHTAILVRKCPYDSIPEPYIVVTSEDWHDVYAQLGKVYNYGGTALRIFHTSSFDLYLKQR